MTYNPKTRIALNDLIEAIRGAVRTGVVVRRVDIDDAGNIAIDGVRNGEPITIARGRSASAERANA
jgi:hypothetical protein